MGQWGIFLLSWGGGGGMGGGVAGVGGGFVLAEDAAINLN